jgi:hypothetical protein
MWPSGALPIVLCQREEQLMGDIAQPDLNSHAFSRRLGELLVEARRRRGCSCRALSRLSAGRFTLSELHELERGEAMLDEQVIESVSDLYGADLGEILPDRQAVFIARGTMSVGGMSANFQPADPNAMLATYLRLVRSLRRQQRAPFVELRREDVERLAVYLDESGEQVVDRLAALMGSTRAQRSSMSALFASGAMVIGIIATLAIGETHATGSSISSTASFGHSDPAGVSVGAVTSAAVVDLAADRLTVESVGSTAAVYPMFEALPSTVPPTAVVPASPAPAASVVVAASGTAPVHHPHRPVTTTPAIVPSASAADGSQVAADLGTGDATTPTLAASATAADGSQVATDLGTGDATTPAVVGVGTAADGSQVATDLGTGDASTPQTATADRPAVRPGVEAPAPSLVAPSAPAIVP